MGAEALRVVALVGDPPSVLVHKEGRRTRKRRSRSSLTERDRCAKRPHHVGTERPRARVVRLVLVQRDDTAIEVDIAQVHRRGLTEAGPLAMQEPVEHAVAEWHRRASTEARLLVGVQPALRFGWTNLREPALRQRALLDQSQREHRKPDDPMDQERVVATRRWRSDGLSRERLHDRLRIVEREVSHPHVSDTRVHVSDETLSVASRRLLGPHVVGVRARQLARRPPLANVSEGALGSGRRTFGPEPLPSHALTPRGPLFFGAGPGHFGQRAEAEATVLAADANPQAPGLAVLGDAPRQRLDVGLLLLSREGAAARLTRRRRGCWAMRRGRLLRRAALVGSPLLDTRHRPRCRGTDLHSLRSG